MAFIESGDVRTLLENPTQPYSIALKGAVLPPDLVEAAAVIRNGRAAAGA